MKGFLVVLGLLVAGAAGFLGGALAVFSRGLPQVSALEDFTPPSSTRVYAADGTLLAEFANEKRTLISLDQMPPDLIRCFLAIEDHRYFQHMGINVSRIFKALLVDALERRIVEGGSTITQQLAKVLFLTPERTFSRKVREAFLALEIERRYTKYEILNLYLNQIYLGNGAYGVASAADVYFAKPVSDLTLSECALLAALPKAPQTYDPFRRPDRARARRALVLRRMADLGWADRAAAEEAAGEALPKPRSRRFLAPYFVEAVRRKLLEHLQIDLVYEGGLRVYTTLDYPLQRAAEEAVTSGVETLQKRYPLKDSPVQAAALAMDPFTGAVRALVGGRDWTESSFDRSLQARRQPGSCFKFFTYLAALESGMSQASTLSDSPVVYPGASPDQPWRPDNYDGKFLGKITLRKALALSRNVPTVRLFDSLGKAKVEELAARLGLQGPFGEGLASSLGVGGTTLQELVRAYAALPAGGLLPEPHLIRAVYNSSGQNLWPGPPAPRKVTEPAVAYVGSDMLRAVVLSGTGQRAASLPFPVAGKTGTTDDFRNAWFVGFSSRLAAGVWVGRDDNRPIGAGADGAHAALPIWIKILAASAAEGRPPAWDVPADVVFAEIDLATGERARVEGDTASAAFVRKQEETTEGEASAPAVHPAGSEAGQQP